MSYYWFNRQEILQKAKEKYSKKKKGAKYHAQNKEAIKKIQEEIIKTCHKKEEKTKIKEYQRKKYQELVQYKKEATKTK